MTRDQRTRRHKPGYNRSFDPEHTPGCHTISISRRLDEDQANEIRYRLSEISPTPGGTILRGRDSTAEPSLLVIGSKESDSLGFLAMYSADEVEAKVRESIPLFSERLTLTILNIGRFGLGRAPKISIAAALKDDGGDRGGVQLALCDLNHWEPVDLRSNVHPHVTLAQMPNNTDDDAVMAYKHEVAGILPPGTELFFEPATIKIR